MIVDTSLQASMETNSRISLKNITNLQDNIPYDDCVHNISHDEGADYIPFEENAENIPYETADNHNVCQIKTFMGITVIRITVSPINVFVSIVELSIAVHHELRSLSFKSEIENIFLLIQ